MADYLITGASAGLGEALARALVARGDRVWGVARRGDRLAELRRELGPERFLASACDVGAPAEVGATLAALEAEGFLPQVVILNAGINRPDLEPEFDLEACADVLRVNLLGALIWVERLLPRFLKEGRGRFVAISSMSAFRPSSRGAAYAASKAALSLAFESLRLRYRDAPVGFTTVHLGPVRTALWPGGRFPLLLEPAEAARRILGAVDRGRDLYDCPASVVLAARLSRILPRRALLLAERAVRGGRR